MAISVSQIKKIYDATVTSTVGSDTGYDVSVRYYNSNNDISLSKQTSIADYKELKRQNTEADAIDGSGTATTVGGDFLRKANNRVSSNFYQILLDQEAGYLATVEPQIDVGDDDINTKIKEVLGDSFALTIQNLIIDVSNAGVGWLHYWIDSNGNFQYAIINPDQIFPVYSDTIKDDVIGVIRAYSTTDDKGNSQTVVEYWNDIECTSFIKHDGNFEEYRNITLTDIATDTVSDVTNTFEHHLGRVPFIKFKKNLYEKPELDKVKGSIDVYDKVYNGFINDLEDIQQTVIVLKDFGGTNLDEFRNQLKRYKAINVDSDGDVNQLKIDIPVEARHTMLELTKQKIFDEGQGIDPEKFMDNGALSGKAVKGLYANLDLKATTTEKHFRKGIGELVRAIMQWLNVGKYETININQTWTRNAIQDEAEKADSLAKLAPFMSKRAIAMANPFIEDADAELENLKDDSMNVDGFGNQDALEGLDEDGEDNDSTTEDGR